MKKILFVLFTLLMITGCGKDEKDTPPINKPTEEGVTVEDIFKNTGCRPTDVKNIETLYLFKDSENTKYLYGSKSKDDTECFWFAKFNAAGEQIWEIINKKEASSHAYGPVQLNNGNIVVCNVTKNSNLELKDASPVLISKDGKAKFIDVYDGYFYSDVHVFVDFFFCSISEKELSKNPKAKPWFVQIDNNGNILNQDGEMNIPEGYAIWKNNNTFISVTSTHIIKKNVKIGYNEPTWDFIPSLPTHSEYAPTAKISKDTVIVEYKLKLPDGKNEIYNYKLSYTTGKDFDDIENPDMYKYLELNIPYNAPDSMTVILHSIDVSDNGQGTSYYTVNYTLENRTKDMIITEGIFEAYLSKNEKGAFQTGFFGKLYPGENISRTYTFRSLSDKPYLFIQYKHDWRGTDADILKKSLKWEIKK